MLITLLTSLTFIFFLLILIFFSLFLDKKEFQWKIIYMLSSWSSLFMFTFYTSEYFLKTFDSYLWDLIFLKNFQDLLTIKIELAFFVANNGLVYVLSIFLYLFIENSILKSRKFEIYFILFAFFYLNFYSFLFVRYDLFLSNWELLYKDLILNKIDIQIDYLLFFHDFFDDWFDFYIFTLIYYCIIFIMCSYNVTISKLRILLYITTFTFKIYFFGLLTLKHLLFLSCFSILMIELSIYFYFVIQILHKIKIKTNYK